MVAITGATGIIFGIRILEMLKDVGIETHLVLSKWASRTMLHETSYSLKQVLELAAYVHQINDQGAAISSGSFITGGMIIAPCSMRTLAAVAHGSGDNLIHRAADVTIKERRKLVLAVREAPLSTIHLENMVKLSKIGVVIHPPVPSFYNSPKTLESMVSFTAARLLDQLGIHVDVSRWDGNLKLAGQ